jgi:hypothetical protein
MKTYSKSLIIREMQNETKTKYHSSLTRIAKIIKTDNQSHVRIWSYQVPPAALVETNDSATILKVPSACVKAGHSNLASIHHHRPTKIFLPTDCLTYGMCLPPLKICPEFSNFL